MSADPSRAQSHPAEPHCRLGQGSPTPCPSPCPSPPQGSPGPSVPPRQPRLPPHLRPPAPRTPGSAGAPARPGGSRTPAAPGMATATPPAAPGPRAVLRGEQTRTRSGDVLGQLPRVQLLAACLCPLSLLWAF